MQTVLSKNEACERITLAAFLLPSDSVIVKMLESSAHKPSLE